MVLTDLPLILMSDKLHICCDPSHTSNDETINKFLVWWFTFLYNNFINLYVVRLNDSCCLVTQKEKVMDTCQKTFKMMGTLISLRIDGENPQLVMDGAEHLLHVYNHRFSANDPESELMQVNRMAGQEPVQVHSELFELIQLGKSHSQADQSFLNIAIGPLVKLWRIGFEDARVPSSKEITARLSLIQPDQILLDSLQQTVYLSQEGMEIDLGALAKGYIADRLVDYIQDQGMQAAMVNLGGNIRTFGPARHQANGLWRVGLQDPSQTRHQHLGTLQVRDLSLVTSGIYERHLQVAGQDYHHIFDPETGYPIDSQLQSITILSTTSVDGEIWTSRLFGWSPQEIMGIIRQQADLEAIVVDLGGHIHASTNLSQWHMT